MERLQGQSDRLEIVLLSPESRSRRRRFIVPEEVFGAGATDLDGLTYRPPDDDVPVDEALRPRSVGPRLDTLIEMLEVVPQVPALERRGIIDTEQVPQILAPL